MKAFNFTVDGEQFSRELGRAIVISGYDRRVAEAAERAKGNTSFVRQGPFTICIITHTDWNGTEAHGYIGVTKKADSDPEDQELAWRVALHRALSQHQESDNYYQMYLRFISARRDGRQAALVERQARETRRMCEEEYNKVSRHFPWVK